MPQPPLLASQRWSQLGLGPSPRSLPGAPSPPLLATHSPRLGLALVASSSPSAKGLVGGEGAWQCHGSCSLEASIGWDLRDVRPAPFLCQLATAREAQGFAKVAQQAAGGARIGSPPVGEAARAFFSSLLWGPPALTVGPGRPLPRRRPSWRPRRR